MLCEGGNHNDSGITNNTPLIQPCTSMLGVSYLGKAYYRLCSGYNGLRMVFLLHGGLPRPYKKKQVGQADIYGSISCKVGVTPVFGQHLIYHCAIGLPSPAEPGLFIIGSLGKHKSAQYHYRKMPGLPARLGKAIITLSLHEHLRLKIAL